MPEQKRNNKLKTESKLLMNVLRMICYRAESAVAEYIAPYLAKEDDEKRMVVKQIIQSNADISPDLILYVFVQKRKILACTLVEKNKFHT